MHEDDADVGCDQDGDDSNDFSLTAEQEAALALEHNVTITAGAGTGKTTTLKERYREILTEHPTVDPTEILTLTFTTDATSEMRERIREVIDDELDRARNGADSCAGADTPGSDYERWRRARDDLEDAYVHTIHGFCSRILREFAVETGLHPEFETLGEGDSGTLVDEAITAVLDRYGAETRADSGGVYGATDDVEWPAGTTGDWDIHEELWRLSRQYSRSSLASVLSGLFDERPDSLTWAERWADESPEAYTAHLSSFVEPSITAAEADELVADERTREAIAALRRLGDLSLAVPEDDSGREVLDTLLAILSETGAHTPDGTARDRQRFLLAVANAVTTNDGSLQSQTWRYAGSKRAWREHDHGEERATLADALETLADVIEPETRNLDHDPDLARNGARQALALARVFLAVRAQYRVLKHRRNALDYSDLLTEAIAFLAANDGARRTLREQFAYIMVDEVQDTDPRQWKLVKLLSGTDPDRFDGRNVFMVGDEKQSIYRFRDADVSQFRTAHAQLLADNPPDVDGDLELTTNFRTVDTTLTVINELFERVLQPAAGDPFAEREGSDTAAEPDIISRKRSSPARNFP